MNNRQFDYQVLTAIWPQRLSFPARLLSRRLSSRFTHKCGIPGQELIKEAFVRGGLGWEINHLTTLYIPPDHDLRSQSYLVLKSSEARKAAMDRKQTWEPQAAHLEETYEVMDAIETEDTENLIEPETCFFRLCFIAGQKKRLLQSTMSLEKSTKMVRRHLMFLWRLRRFQPKRSSPIGMIKNRKADTNHLRWNERIPKAFTAFTDGGL